MLKIDELRSSDYLVSRQNCKKCEPVRSLSVCLVAICVAFAFWLASCDQVDINIFPGFYAAFLRTDGRIQTNWSPDGVSWPETGRITHSSIDTFAPVGPGIAVNPTNGIVALALFVMSDNNLLPNVPFYSAQLGVILGFGNAAFEEIDERPGSFFLTTTVASSPSMTYIDNGTFVLAWNDGVSGLRIVYFDSQNNRSPWGAGENPTTVWAVDISGAPSIAYNDERALMVWRSGEGNTIQSATGTIGDDSRIMWESQNDLQLQDDLFGCPSVAWDGSQFLMALRRQSAIVSDEERLLYEKIVVLGSENGREWQEIATSSGLLARAGDSDFYALASGNDTTLLPVARVADTSDQSLILRFRSTSSNSVELSATDWSSAFGNQGAPNIKPAVTFSPGSNGSTPDPGGSQRGPNLNEGLVAHYTFDEVEEATFGLTPPDTPQYLFRDSSGNGNHGVWHPESRRVHDLPGLPPLRPDGPRLEDGVIGRALYFNGEDNYITIEPQSDVSSITDFTISVWTHLTDWKRQDDEAYRTKRRQGIFGGTSCSEEEIDDYRQGFSLVYGCYWREIRGDEEIRNVIKFSDFEEADAPALELQKGLPVQIETEGGDTAQVDTVFEQWVHHVFVRDESGVRLYLNGSPVELGDQDIIFRPNEDSFRPGENSIQQPLNMQHMWFIGRSVKPSHQPEINYHFCGFLDDLRIYNQALNDDEIRALFNLRR